jgi:ligand-binding sensor domain-containing protein/signal transduction histidine kinase
MGTRRTVGEQVLTFRAELTLSPIIRTVLIGVVIVSCTPAYALNPDFALSKYAHRSWGSDSGLQTVRRVAQTPDGYLWLATTGGLVRFDGVRFTTHERASGQSLVNSSSLLVDPDGSLWVATFGGVVAHYQSGTFRAYGSRDGLPSEPIQALYLDSKGALWVGTREGGIFRLAHGRFEKIALDTPAGSVFGFVEDSDQSLWIATYGNGLFRLRNGSLRAFSVEDGLPDNHVVGLYQDRAGRIWTFGLKGISKWNGTRFVGYPAVNAVVNLVAQCTEDRDGNLWIASATSGLFRMRDGHVTKMDTSSGLSADNVQAVYEDQEGNIWIGTAVGLDRLGDAQIRTFTGRDGLFRGAEVFQWPIVADRSAGVWTASGERIGRISESRIDIRSAALPLGSRAYTMQSLPDSRFLIGFNRGLRVWNSAHPGSSTEAAGLDVRCLLQARDGSIWIGTANRGLLHWKSYLVPQTKFDVIIPDKSVTSLAEDLDGTIWAGSHAGGLYRIAKEQIEHFGRPEGLPSTDILTVFVDRSGALWIGSAGGLSWFHNGRIRTANSEHGLRSDLVLAILDDAYDRLWFLSHAGITVIEKKSLSEWAAGRVRQLNPAFHRAEGLPLWTVERTFPNAAESVDGHLWFVFGLGLAEVIPSKPLAMHFPVVIENVTIDGNSYSPLGQVRVRPAAHSIEIPYTALTLSNSESIRFRYRLEGVDADWIDAGDRRSAFYSNLKPGTYAFRVKASAGADQWLESSPLVLEQMPSFYQTRTFVLLITVAATACVFLIYRLRLRLAVDRINAGFDQRITERTRIARELHDTLLQSFQGLMLRLQVVDDLLPAGKAKHHLEQALERADQAIAEGRDAVYDLRGSAAATNDLAQAVRALGEELATSDSAAFNLLIEGAARDLNPIVRDEVYRITREALRNAFRHARARRVETEIVYGQRAFRVRIRDDGDGIEHSTLEKGRTGHYGLEGMRERARQVAGTLEIWSRPGVGTEIDLRIDGAIVYAPSTDRRWLGLFRKRAG